jgi:hypothetical protein
LHAALHVFDRRLARGFSGSPVVFNVAPDGGLQGGVALPKYPSILVLTCPHAFPNLAVAQYPTCTRMANIPKMQGNTARRGEERRRSAGWARNGPATKQAADRFANRSLLGAEMMEGGTYDTALLARAPHVILPYP